MLSSLNVERDLKAIHFYSKVQFNRPIRVPAL